MGRDASDPRRPWEPGGDFSGRQSLIEENHRECTFHDKFQKNDHMPSPIHVSARRSIQGVATVTTRTYGDCVRRVSNDILIRSEIVISSFDKGICTENDQQGILQELPWQRQDEPSPPLHIVFPHGYLSRAGLYELKSPKIILFWKIIVRMFSKGCLCVYSPSVTHVSFGNRRHYPPG